MVPRRSSREERPARKILRKLYREYLRESRESLQLRESARESAKREESTDRLIYGNDSVYENHISGNRIGQQYSSSSQEYSSSQQYSSQQHRKQYTMFSVMTSTYANDGSIADTLETMVIRELVLAGAYFFDEKGRFIPKMEAKMEGKSSGSGGGSGDGDGGGGSSGGGGGSGDGDGGGGCGGGGGSVNGSNSGTGDASLSKSNKNNNNNHNNSNNTDNNTTNNIIPSPPHPFSPEKFSSTTLNNASSPVYRHIVEDKKSQELYLYNAWIARINPAENPKKFTPIAGADGMRLGQLVQLKQVIRQEKRIGLIQKRI
jgi:hypothetical protein